MKIALIGYGKMGRMIEEIARQRGHDIVAIIDIDNQEDFQSEAFRSADVAIEFTAPQAAWQNVQQAWAQGVKVVSGSTGWMKEHEQEVREACGAAQPALAPSANADSPSAATQHALVKTLFWASNFSVGVAVFSAVNRYLATIMNGFPQYDVQMEETHHVHKLDHPSGTAITLADQILERVSRKHGWKAMLEESADAEAPEKPEADGQTASSELLIKSYRRGEVPGIHTIRYDSEADSITITHDAHSRRGFALGAVLAAEFTKDHEGLLSISDMFPF